MSSLNIVGIVALSLVGVMLIYSIFIAPFIRRGIERKKAEQLDKTISQFKDGDKVLLAGGIRGYYVKRKADTLYIEIAKDVVIRVDKHSVIGVYE